MEHFVFGLGFGGSAWSWSVANVKVDQVAQDFHAECTTTPRHIWVAIGCQEIRGVSSEIPLRSCR